MSKPLSALLLVPLLVGLSACSGDNEELQQWMEQEHRATRPNVPPIYPPKKFNPQAYEGLSGGEPFGVQKLAAGGAVGTRPPNAAVAREQQRAPEALESFPLDAMTMVGAIIRSAKAPHALLRVDRMLHDVKLGDHIGQNYGEITKITETEISLREWVQDAAGEWVERTSTLQLQEKAR